MLGIILGGGVSVAIVILQVFLRRGIESPEQLEELGVNVYASIPVSETFLKKRAKVLNGIKLKELMNIAMVY